MASVIDQLSYSNELTVWWASQGKHAPDPPRFPRPGETTSVDVPNTKRKASKADMVRFFKGAARVDGQ